MANPTSAPWPARWPGYLPFPTPIPRSRGQVPNQQSVDWPQAQFAPLYLPPGSPSFQPYSYDKNDVPLAYLRPHYDHSLPPALVPQGAPWAPATGPDGDIDRLPTGGLMSFLSGLFTGSAVPHLRYSAADRSQGWGWRTGTPTATPVAPPAVRWGARTTAQAIPAGIPHLSSEFVPPAPVATAGLTPLGNSGYALGGLALENGDCIGCGDYGSLDALSDFFTSEEGGWNWGAVVGTVLVAASAWVLATKPQDQGFLSAAKSKAASLSGGLIAFNNPRRRKRRKGKKLSKAARSRAAKKGWARRRRRSR